MTALPHQGISEGGTTFVQTRLPNRNLGEHRNYRHYITQSFPHEKQKEASLARDLNPPPGHLIFHTCRSGWPLNQNSDSADWKRRPNNLVENGDDAVLHLAVAKKEHEPI